MVQSIFGLDQIDWGGNAGKFFECWKVEPCCGSPVNGGDALTCCCNWCCLGHLSFAKLYATALGHEHPACIHHILMTVCCGFCTAVATHKMIRERLGRPGHIVGDCVCVWCCGCCSFFRMLRASKKEDWKVIDAIAPKLELIK